ncbi:flagellar basal body rod protein FlgG [compost metagenome]
MDEQGNLLDPATGLPSGAKIGISIVTRPQELVRDGNGVFHADDADAAEIRFAEDGDNLLLRQGYIEGSNVDATQVTVDMNAAYRAYEANQKVIQFYDTSLQKAVNEVGRV